MRHDPHRLERSTYPHLRRFDTMFADMDVQWHVNNVAIARFFEEARASLHRAAWDLISGRSAPMVLARVEIDYLRTVAYPGTIEIGIGIHRVGNRSFEQAAALFQDGRCAALSMATSVCLSGDRSRPAEITDAERGALEHFLIRPAEPAAGAGPPQSGASAGRRQN
jgi:acyl-CoA thioester hydrolase